MKRKPIKRKKKEMDWLPFVALTGTTVGLMAAYLGAEMALQAGPHPLHWLSAAVGGVVGYGAGLLWYRWRGDII
jgi:hypothetical protein